ncbi:MAG TPA: methyl-accepting chemotaxis protein [Bryobacteraceae bacterium]|nr:methyl-accepting chemotaxis protein [Bryobacteraceae bacterium]
MSRMTIGKKLTISFGAMLAVALALAVSSLYSIGKLGGELDTAVDKHWRKAFLIEEIKSNFYKMRSCQRGVMLFSMHNLPDKARVNKEEFESRAAAVEQLLREGSDLLVTEPGRQNMSFMEGELPHFKAYFEQVAAAAVAGKPQDALSIYTEHSVKSLDALEKSAEELTEQQKKLMQESSASTRQLTYLARGTAWILLLVSVALASVVFFTVQQTSQRLRGVAADLAEGAEQITSASSQVASSSQSLAQGASEQAASLEETSASSEEISSMTRQNAGNSQSAAAMMTEVDHRIAQGNRTLEQMVVSMREITSSSDKISKIIKVIDEIAFQTNILALNAAVEAARAGEAGMGFAVVADEVRNLAQRSAQAAKDTAALIEESIGKSNEGSAKLQQVTQVIQAITESAIKVKTLVDEVNLGSQEQARGINQISKAIAQMDQVTQSTAANAEESASASQEMSAQAEALNNIAQQLRSMVGGDGTEFGSRLRPDRRAVYRPATKSLRAPRPGVGKRARKPVEAAVSAASHSAFPMEDNFTEL